MKTVKSSKDFKTMQELFDSLYGIYKDTKLDYKEKHFAIKDLLKEAKEALVYDMARDELNTKLSKQNREIYLDWVKDHISEILKPETGHLFHYLDRRLDVDMHEMYCKLLLRKKDSGYCDGTVVVEKATIAEEIVELKEAVKKLIFKTTVSYNATTL